MVRLWETGRRPRKCLVSRPARSWPWLRATSFVSTTLCYCNRYGSKSQHYFQTLTPILHWWDGLICRWSITRDGITRCLSLPTLCPTRSASRMSEWRGCRTSATRTASGRVYVKETLVSLYGWVAMNMFIHATNMMILICLHLHAKPSPPSSTRFPAKGRGKAIRGCLCMNLN